MNVHAEETVALDKRSPGVKDIETILRPKLPPLYARRQERLRQLAAGHPEADYLSFIADLVAAQSSLLATQPLAYPSALPESTSVAVQTGLDEPSVQAYWMGAVRRLTSSLHQAAPPALLDAMTALRDASPQALADIAAHLRQGQFGAVDALSALLVWSALSLTAAQYADFVVNDRPVIAPTSERGHCPLCGCAPTGSLILSGDRAGLRYLQCGLCETRWHMVRSTCSNCDDTAALDYWSLDDVGAAVKAESCGHCGSYLKVFYAEHDPQVEVVADDLATLLLDMAVSERGFQRTGVSPFSFPAD